MMSSLHFYFKPTFNTHVMKEVFVFIKSGCKYSRSLLPILSCLLFLLLPTLISGQFPFMGKGEEKLPIGFPTQSTEDPLVSMWTSLWRGSLPSWLRDQAPPRRSCMEGSNSWRCLCFYEMLYLPREDFVHFEPTLSYHVSSER